MADDQHRPDEATTDDSTRKHSSTPGPGVGGDLAGASGAGGPGGLGDAFDVGPGGLRGRPARFGSAGNVQEAVPAIDGSGDAAAEPEPADRDASASPDGELADHDRSRHGVQERRSASDQAEPSVDDRGDG